MRKGEFKMTTQIMIEVSKVEDGLAVNVISNHAVDPIAALGIVEVAKTVILNGGMKVVQPETENVEQ
jgi:predicted Fe-Mo cluster-binding NifX family protein